MQAAAAVREVEARHGLACLHLHGGADRRLALHVECRLRGSIAYARFDAPGHIHPPEVGTVEELGLAFGIDDGLQAERHVEVGRFHYALRACESAGSDTDDGDRNLVQHDGLAQRRGRAIVVAQPDSVADDGDVSGAGRGVVGGLERAAKLWADFEHVKIITGDHGGVDALRVAMNGFVAVAIPAEHAKLFRVRDIDALIEQLLCDGEDSGICANGQRQRCRGYEREARALAQDAKSILKIRPQLIPPPQPQGSAHLFLVNRDRAQGDSRVASPFGGRLAGTDKICSEIFKMISELCLHLIFETIAVDNGAQPGTRLSKHGSEKRLQAHSLPILWSPSKVPCPILALFPAQGWETTNLN